MNKNGQDEMSTIFPNQSFTSIDLFLKHKVKNLYVRPSIIVVIFFMHNKRRQMSIQNDGANIFIFFGSLWLNNDSNGNIGYDDQFFYYITKYLFNDHQYLTDALSFLDFKLYATHSLFVYFLLSGESK